jgi:hypothetical protein
MCVCVYVCVCVCVCVNVRSMCQNVLCECNITEHAMLDYPLDICYYAWKHWTPDQRLCAVLICVVISRDFNKG